MNNIYVLVNHISRQNLISIESDLFSSIEIHSVFPHEHMVTRWESLMNEWRKELLGECSSVEDEENNKKRREKDWSQFFLYSFFFSLMPSSFSSSGVDGQLLYFQHMHAHAHTHSNVIHPFGMRGVAFSFFATVAIHYSDLSLGGFSHFLNVDVTLRHISLAIWIRDTEQRMERER